MLCNRCGDEMEETVQVETNITVDNEGERKQQRYRRLWKCEMCGNQEAEQWLSDSP